MMMKSIPTHNAALFTWENNRGVVDISDLGPRPMSRIYDDACDVGFFIRSPRTGRHVLFFLVNQLTNDHWEVQEWRCASKDQEYEVVLFND